MNSPYAGNMGGTGSSAGAGNGQTTQDLQDQKAQNAFQEEMTKESNMESKRNQTRMGVIANLK
ncbi:hypothetical protein [Paraburkholderia dinghuensis]|uniref:Uncharacterized protein n=1 Tax=Paraburkholderia dinghuensis TaxID=2305225 RepID=A0A3N6Q1Z9_9BURK|nr:hypothetical protein [Paraburkholderia dinghuensis]RQH09090.1 hypothetical protein D1Y85_04300 [Paraburkholderia dinghuensis]